MPSSNQSKPQFGQAFCGLLILAAIIGGGYCFYHYAIPKIEESINDFAEAKRREMVKEKVIHESTGPFIWTLTNENDFSTKLVISGGVSYYYSKKTRKFSTIWIPDHHRKLFLQSWGCKYGGCSPLLSVTTRSGTHQINHCSGENTYTWSDRVVEIKYVPGSCRFKDTSIFVTLA